MREDRGGDTERNGGGEGREESRVVGLFLLPSLPFSAFASELGGGEGNNDYGYLFVYGK